MADDEKIPWIGACNDEPLVPSLQVTMKSQRQFHFFTLGTTHPSSQTSSVYIIHLILSFFLITPNFHRIKEAAQCLLIHSSWSHFIPQKQPIKLLFAGSAAGSYSLSRAFNSILFLKISVDVNDSETSNTSWCMLLN